MTDFDFSYLKTVLLGLPDSPIATGSVSSYDFRHYVPSSDGLDKTESTNGTVNYNLEKILGYERDGLVLNGNGPGMVALADLLNSYTTQFRIPNDAVLALWGPAVLATAQAIYTSAGKPVSTIRIG
ncbi:hypothetical protein CTheo_8699 [Ceratobasidium theobromae]|uniref:Uncharacterized protein n=1 Tax=Ceratobasidium theobromae TaxID=1582974 RepID=A0A5N5Q7W1_9AGAM|nr:hypothetical protein CTheo_8699 [Ceratobasidium theobromae]